MITRKEKNSHKILIVFPFSLEAMPLIEKFHAEKVGQDLWETPEMVFAACGQGSLRATALTTHLLTIYSSIEKAIMVTSFPVFSILALPIGTKKSLSLGQGNV